MTLNTCSAHQRKGKLATNAILQVSVALSHGVKKRNELRKVSRRKEEEKRQEKGREIKRKREMGQFRE